jgi:hypothetical protein
MSSRKKRSSRPQFILDDAYGRGEALFALKCSDPSDEVVAAIDAMIAEKDPPQPASEARFQD